MRVCAECGQRFEDGVRSCPYDAGTLADAALVDHVLGSTVGNFRVEQLLGAGGMGAVFLATHKALETPAVIKFIHPEDVDEVAPQRFLNEARLASTIQHENVVRIYDFGELEEGTLYAIMELVPGEDLEELLRREGKVEPFQATRLLRQVAAALEAAHDPKTAGVIHRDLKPANIRITRRGRKQHVTVLDFGIARTLETPVDGEITGADDLVGTPAYMSPEQCIGGDLDARSDLYAFGIIAHEMLTGRPPFEAPTALGLIKAHMTDKPPTLPVDAGIPRALSELVARCLSKDRDERPANATELVETLDAVLSEVGAARIRRRARNAILATLGLAAVVVAILYLVRPDSTRSLLLESLHTGDREVTGVAELYTREPSLPLTGTVAGLGPGERAQVVALVAGREAARAEVRDGAFALMIKTPEPGQRWNLDLDVLEDSPDASPVRVLHCSVERDVRPPRLRLDSGEGARAFPEADGGTRVLVRDARMALPLLVDDETGIDPDSFELVGAGEGARVQIRQSEDGVHLSLTPGSVHQGEELRVEIRVADRAGNLGRLQATLRMDALPPAIALTAPRVDGDALHLTASTQDLPLVVPVTARIDEPGEVTAFVAGTGPSGAIAPVSAAELRREGERIHLAHFELPLRAEGTYELEVRAEDQAGIGRAALRVELRVPLRLDVQVLVDGTPATAGGRVAEGPGPAYVRSRGGTLRLWFDKAILGGELLVRAAVPAGPAPVPGPEAGGAEPASRIPIPAADRPPIELPIGLGQNCGHDLLLTVRAAPNGEEVRWARTLVHDDEAPAVTLEIPGHGWPRALGRVLAGDGDMLRLAIRARDANLEAVARLYSASAATPEQALENLRETRVAREVTLDASGDAQLELPLVRDAYSAFAVTVRDRAGNVGRIERTMRIDLSPPVVTLQPSRHAYLVGDEVQVRISTSEPLERLTVNGESELLRYEGNLEYVYRRVMYLDTPLRLEVEAEDELGNRTRAATELNREPVCARDGFVFPAAVRDAFLNDPGVLPVCPGACQQPVLERGAR